LVVLERFQCLVAIERFQWKVPMEGSNGRWYLKEERETSFSSLLTFFPNTLTWTLIFSLILRFYHGSRLWLYAFFAFSLTYKLQSHISMYQVFHTFIVKLILIEDLFSFPWLHGIMHDHFLRVSNYTSEWRTTFGVIPKFDIDVTSSWWRSLTVKSAPSSWSWTPLSLVLSHFFELSHLGNFLANWPCFWWWTWSRLWRLLWNWRHFYLHMVFNSWLWTLSLVTRSNLLIAS